MNTRCGFILALLAVVMALILPVAGATAGDRAPRDEADRFKPRADAAQRHRVPESTDLPVHGPVQGKAGVDRFEVDASRVVEYTRADGTVIMNLNGEGMDKMVLAGAAGSPRAVCESMLETPLGRAPSVPADFRGRARRAGQSHVRR